MGRRTIRGKVRILGECKSREAEDKLILSLFREKDLDSHLLRNPSKIII